MSQNPYKVPKPMQARFDEVVALTDPFCSKHLTAEYAELARQMTAALARKRPSPLARGGVHTWACAILYALGQVNFLFDPEQEPHMRADQLCKHFGISPSTGGAKAKAIRDALKMDSLDPRWSLPSQLNQHPTAWLIMLDGFIVDARQTPVEIQRRAYELGLIPYVYAERLKE